MLEKIVKKKKDIDKHIGAIVRTFLNDPYDPKLDDVSLYKSPIGEVYHSRRDALSYFFTDESTIFESSDYEKHITNKLKEFLRDLYSITNNKTGNGFDKSNKSSDPLDLDNNNYDEYIEQRLRDAVYWYIELYVHNKVKEENRDLKRNHLRSMFDNFIDTLNLYSRHESNDKISYIGRYFITISLLEKKRHSSDFDFSRLPNYFYEEYKKFLDSHPRLSFILSVYGLKLSYEFSYFHEFDDYPAFLEDSILRSESISYIVKHFKELGNKYEKYKNTFLKNNIDEILKKNTKIDLDSFIAQLYKDSASFKEGSYSGYMSLLDRYSFIVKLLYWSVSSVSSDANSIIPLLLRGGYGLTMKLNDQIRSNDNLDLILDKYVLDGRRKSFLKFIVCSADFFEYIYDNISKFSKKVIEEEMDGLSKEERDLLGPYGLVDETDYLTMFNKLMSSALSQIPEERRELLDLDSMNWFWVPSIRFENTKKPFKEKHFPKIHPFRRRRRR